MIPEQRKRGGQAIQARMAALHLTIPRLAKVAGVSENTIRHIVNGDRWPQFASRERICEALGWPPGELARRAVSDRAEIEEWTTVEIVEELARLLDALRERIIDGGFGPGVKARKP